MGNQTKVLITGACGNLGGKLSRHLRAQGSVSITLVDSKPARNQQVVVSDLSTYDESWVQLFRDQEVIVHLAGDPRPDAPWPSLQKHNVDAIINVYTAAVAHNVKRVVFASSCHVVFGYSEPNLVNHESVPKPVNFYGVTKVFGERLGESYSKRHGLSVICLRIGTIRRDENVPNQDAYQRQRQWLSNRDFCQVAEKAMFVPDVKFATLFVTSNITNPLWDLSETRRVLDYQPKDSHIPVRPSRIIRLKGRVKRVLLRGSRKVMNLRRD